MRGREAVIIGAALAALGAAAAALAQAEGDRFAWFAEAKAVFEGQCNVCHSLERALSKTFDRETWVATVERMHDNGAEVDGRQRRQVVDFLATKNLFERTCSGCHDLGLALGGGRSGADWVATVTRMAGKSPGAISEAEVAAIAAYLAVVSPSP